MSMPKGPRPPFIHDEFTELRVSKVRRSQLRNRRDGKCMVCGKPSAPYPRCPKHAAAYRESNRRRRGCTRRNLNAKSYQREAAANDM